MALRYPVDDHALSEEDRLILKVLHLYYEHDLTQAEVALRMGFSRPKVSKLLAEGRERGLVKIEIAERLLAAGDSPGEPLRPRRGPRRHDERGPPGHGALRRQGLRRAPGAHLRREDDARALLGCLRARPRGRDASGGLRL